ncbi:MAG: hypothetical protein IKC26_04060 [Clostridia bacterium]|nr:hypothetical protein [Clostridia bacterium]
MNKTTGIRLIGILLCLLLALAVFAACDSSSGGDETTTGGQQETNTETVTVSNAVIVSSASADSDTAAAVQVLVDAIKQYTGADATVKTDAELEDATKTEILIGSTNRTQSEDVLADLNGQSGYVVKKVDNKIVINATNVMMIDDAVSYFVNNYVSGGSEGKFEIAKDLAYTYGSTGGVTLLGADNTCQYKVVFSQIIDAKGGTEVKDDGTVVYNPDVGVDYIAKFIIGLQSGLGEAIGVAVPTDTDLLPAEDEKLEILVGSTNRPETRTFQKFLKPNEYGYGVVGNKLVIAGWGDYTTAMAIEAFLENFDAFLVDVDGGLKNLVMADGEKQIFSYDSWNVNVPFPQNGGLSGVLEGLNNSYYACYDGASREDYAAYRSQLEEAGFDLWQEHQIGENLYATYYNSKAVIHTYHLASINSIRVAVDHASRTELPPVEDTSPNYGEKVTDVTFTMHDFDGSKGNWGNAFIITLEDGSFIFHDGGANEGSVESEELWKLLNHLNKRKDGKIVIAAYILSHGHADHHNAWDGLINKYYREMTVERIIYGEPATTQIYPFYPKGHYGTSGLLTVAAKTQATLHRAHTGQTFQIRNLKIEVMLATETLYPNPPLLYNSTSLITRFTAGEGDNAQSLMVTGDTQDVGSNRLVELYKEALKCDAVQVAHHSGGGTVDLYKYCSPSIVLWPSTYEVYNRHMTAVAPTYYPAITQSLMSQKNVVLIVIADEGHKTISLPLSGLTTDRTKNEKLIEVLPRFDGK